MPDQFKTAIRKSIQQVRSNLSINYRNTSAKQICTRIRAMEYYRQAKHVALYHNVNGEVDLHDLWSSAPMQGKFCYFPVVQDNSTLLFLPVTPNTEFKPNAFGIPEPVVSKDLAIPVDELDLIIMPLVAFDIRCSRIGMGSGYYDRSLANKTKCKLFGVAYQFQRVDCFATQDWDVPLDAVITQKALYWRQDDEL